MPNITPTELMKILATIFFLLSFSFGLMAQRICGSETYFQQFGNVKPQKNNRQLLSKEGVTALRDTLPNELISIPVVVHVLYATDVQNISDDQIKSQIESLNKDFSYQNADRNNAPEVFRKLGADIRIRFCLAQTDPKGNKTSGIVRKQTSTVSFAADDKMKFNGAGGDDAWDSERYLNIWVCGLSSRSLGYATPPGGSADRDGVVIAYDVFGTVGNLRKPFDKGRTATHEIGHWLGLKHIWGDTDCGDDGIDDTPRQKSYNFGCPSFPRITDCSADANGDMFMNFMDFSDDGCMNMFTVGQRQKMRSLFAKGAIRNTFLVSSACTAPVAAEGVPAAVEIPAETIAAPSFKIYPSLVNTTLTVEYKSAATLSAKTINIFNVYGAKVYSTVINQVINGIPVGHLSSGVYIVQIGEGKTAFVAKFIKQ